jgi:hypothetical protein
MLPSSGLNKCKINLPRYIERNMAIEVIIESKRVIDLVKCIFLIP